ncbi:MAG: hypothetical protein BWY75_01677 [bacterium ADurb.Bin425]|nr:MAG: hypothetical protein BWY75_01677 [bacterium ADurb.Bin425]
MIFVEPKHGIAQKEVAYFVASIIKDIGAPFAMLALTGVGMFIKMGAVKKAEGMSVPRKMRRHPVDDHAYISLVQAINQEHQVFRRAKSGSGSKVAGGLIAPTTIQWML